MFCVIALWGVVSIIDGFTRDQTIKELARSRGGTGTRVIYVEVPVLQPSDLLPMADLVIHARVLTQNTALSDDEMHIVTEYGLKPLAVIAARGVQVTQTPSLLPIRVRQLGGKLVVDGLQLETVVDVFPAHSVAPGSEVIFFLARMPTKAFYEIVGGPFGAFQIREGKVRSLTDEVAARRAEEAVSLTAFLEALKRAGR